MRSLSLILAGAIVGGCAPPPETVFVDVDRLAGAASAPTAPPAMPRPPAPMRFSAGGGAPTPATVVRDPSQEDEGTSARAIEAAQQRAVRTLANRLRQLYERDVRDFAREEEARLKGQELEAFQAFRADLLRLFDRYAQQRAPHAIELALTAGNPDMGTPTGGFDARFRAERAQKARGFLIGIRELFDRDVQAALDGAFARFAVDRAAMLGRIEEFRAEMEARADQEAADQVRVQARDLGLRLTHPQDFVVPSQEAASAAIRPGPAFAPIPAPPSVGPTREEILRDLRHDAELWAKTQGYALGRGRDATAEFERWRRDRLGQ